VHEFKSVDEKDNIARGHHCITQWIIIETFSKADFKAFSFRFTLILYLKYEMKNIENRPTAAGWLSQKITLKKARNYLVTLPVGFIQILGKVTGLGMRVNVLGVLTSAIPR